MTENAKAPDAAAPARADAPVCVALALACAIAIIGIFAFLVFTDFGASADYIYNQF